MFSMNGPPPSLRLDLVAMAAGICMVAACGSDGGPDVDTSVTVDAGRADVATGGGDGSAAPADTPLGADASVTVDAGHADTATGGSDGPASTPDGSSASIDAVGPDGYPRTGRECSETNDPMCIYPEQIYCAPGSTACIYDYQDCTGAIEELEGRHGNWYSFDPSLDGGASTALHNTSGMPILWGLGGCGIWKTGGSIALSDAALSEADAIGVGFTLADGAPYDACTYAGIELTYASASPLDVAFRHDPGDASAAVAEQMIDAADSRYVTIQVPFPAGVCSHLTSIEFRAASSYVALAVRKVTFY